ncbi:MAG: hypothetical protein ABJL54_15755 [Halioglobus sp.]
MTKNSHADSTGNSVLPFPGEIPAGYLPLIDEPEFDPGRHLALEPPQSISSLEELGYSAESVAQCPSAFGVSAAFRILSDEGLSVMEDICSQIYFNRNDSGGTGKTRLGSFARGAGYRSCFIRDFCDSVDLAEHLSRIAGVQLGRHSVPAVACGINYAPEDIAQAVDTWHVDSVAFDVVMMISDPSVIKGGEFQVFQGTKDEGRSLLGIRGEEGRDSELPADRVKTITFPAAGYGFLQQGNMIFHRACRLLEKAERVTMIPSFEVLPASCEDATNSINMLEWTDPGLEAELARREIWRTAARLNVLLDTISVSDDRSTLQRLIEDALEPLGSLQASLEKPRL